MESAEHRRLARRLRDRVTDDAGVTDVDLRRRLLERSVDDDTAVARLAARIRDGAYRVIDRDVDAVVSEVGSEKKAFEVIVAASAGEALRRWDAALEAIDGSFDATS